MVVVIVDCAVYRAGKRVATASAANNVVGARNEAQTEQDGFVWIGLHEPTEEEMSEVAFTFDLHPLAVEDALKAHQRPKLERYPNNLTFMVLRTLWYVDKYDAVETGEIAVFVGKDFVVTVRHGSGGELSLTRRDLEEHQNVLGHGPFSVLYSVCDHVVDEYSRVADELQTDVDEIELSVFSSSRTKDAQRIYALKREVSEFRRAVAPLREPLNRLSRAELPEMDPRAGTFFRDVADHAILVTDRVEGLDNLLSSAHDAHMARISVQQNDDMRRISAWVAIVAVPTMIAGIYGMNFVNIPELHWHYGYYIALTVMAVACMLLYRVFKRSGWL